MTVELTLAPEQVAAVQPLFSMRPSHILVASVHPTGAGWALSFHPVPAERRDAIRVACAGTLPLPRHTSKSTTPKQAKAI